MHSLRLPSAEIGRTLAGLTYPAAHGPGRSTFARSLGDAAVITARHSHKFEPRPHLHDPAPFHDFTAGEDGGGRRKMAKGFDDLIEFLLEEIALRGEQGTSTQSSAVASRRAKNSARFCAGDESPPHSLPCYLFEEIFSRRFCLCIHEPR